MRAIVFDQPGPPEVLHLGEVACPEMTPAEVRIRVESTAVNRADLMQRMGMYPPPPGASTVLGLECAGEIVETGAAAAGGFRMGERVMALLPGGGYAEEATVDAGSVMRVPQALTIEEAGALPEVFLTAFLNLFLLGQAQKEGFVLVHGGGSGVGTAALALCKEAGVRALVTAGSEEKCKRTLDLGATAAFNYRSGDFADAARAATGGRGVDVVLDCVGGRYLSSNLQALAAGGRLVVIGLIGGARAELDLALLLMRRISIIGSTLRARPASEKAAIVSAFLARFGDALQAGRLRPVLDRVLPLERAKEAHLAMQASEHFGKIALRVGA